MAISIVELIYMATYDESPIALTRSPQMETAIVGRQKERQILEQLFTSKEPEFLAIYGRRRVGKTFLVKEFFEGRCPLFVLTGEKGATVPEQLENFTFAFRTAFPDEPPPHARSWRQAFHTLASAIDRKYAGKRIVIFLDELPWLASPKSKFLNVLDHFWNAWATRRNLMLIVCGSAASWIIGRLLNNKGGLYNRVTARIRLEPFTLAETEAYLKHRQINMTHKDLLELYMCLGGIPHYLRGVQRGESVPQTVDRLSFSKDGLLNEELDRLFESLFEESGRHMAVIRALAGRRRGATRADLLLALGEVSGGGLTRVLGDLDQSAFIARVSHVNRSKREALYHLVDEHSLFHLTWIESMQGQGEGYWIGRRNSRAFQTWSALAFESVCLKHVAQIKHGLGIGAVSTTQSGWFAHTPEGRAQIDLVIDRADHCVNLCEIKYTDSQFTITGAYAENLSRKVSLFRNATKTRKTCFVTQITPYGCTRNRYFARVDAELTADALFASL